MKKQVSFLSMVFIGLFLVIYFACTQKATGQKSDVDKDLEMFKQLYTLGTLPAVQAGDTSEVLAEINGEKIYDSQLETELKGPLFEFRKRIYDLKRQYVEQYVEGKLMDAEAKARNISLKELFLKEVLEKSAPVTDQDAQAYWDQNKQQTTRKYEEVAGRIKEMLKRKSVEDARQKFLTTLKQKTPVSISMKEPQEPKYNVAVGDKPFRGNKDATVTIIEFSDFQCPYCKRGSEIMKEVSAKYGDKIRFTFHHFPLGFHQRAMPAAEASECALEQGKFWEYHDLLWENNRKLEDGDLLDYAKKVGLKVVDYQDCMSSHKYQAKVQADMDAGSALGINGVPVFFINGRKLTGAKPIKEFSDIIDQELQPAK
jgi:protein-disulfide isomerase